MSCCACQEQEAEINLGCLHNYCRACLDHLGGRCRDGCVPVPGMPIEDARSILEDEESRLESLELLAHKTIKQAEDELNKIQLDFKRRIDLRYAKVKRAETDLLTLLERPKLPTANGLVIREYAKVHLESECEEVKITWFTLTLYCNSKLVGYKIIFQNGDTFIACTDPQAMGEHWTHPHKITQGYNLLLLAKSQSMLALGCPRKKGEVIIVDLEEKLATSLNFTYSGADLLYFKNKVLVSCSVPEGFEKANDNIAIRLLDQSDRFEIFDPAVGKPELVIANLSLCQASTLPKEHLTYGYSSRACVHLNNRHRFGIPYLS